MKLAPLLVLALLLAGCSTKEPRDEPPETTPPSYVTPGTTTDPTPNGTGTQPQGRTSWAGPCEGDGRVPFEFAPVEPSNLTAIVPMGRMFQSHVTPTDHQYWQVASDQPIRAPAAGLVSVQSFPQPDDHRLVISHTCTFHSVYIHVHQLGTAAAEALRTNQPMRVEAGEVLGHASAPSFDFSVHDSNVTLAAFRHPENYSSEPWKVHTIDAFDAFGVPLRDELRAKSTRLVEPLGGRIDWDEPGKARGNWFTLGRYANGEVPDYWKTHLAIAPHHNDPEKAIVSLGDLDGGPAQLAPMPGEPDPRALRVGEPALVVAIVDADDATGAPAAGPARAWIRLELTGENALRAQTFGSLDAAQAGFTSAARDYTR